MRLIRGAMTLLLTFLVALSFVFTDTATCMEIDFDNLCYRNSRLTDKFANPWTNQAGSAAWYVYGRLQESMHTTNRELREAKFGDPLFSNDTNLWRVDVQELQDSQEDGFYVYPVGAATAGVPEKGDIAVWGNGHVAFVENAAGNVTESGIDLPRTPITPAERKALVGQNIVINWNGINLRKQAGLNGKRLRTLKMYSVWKIVDGPTFNKKDPYAWYKIQESGNIGWVALQFGTCGQSMSRVFLQANPPFYGAPMWYLRIPKKPPTS